MDLPVPSPILGQEIPLNGSDAGAMYVFQLYVELHELYVPIDDESVGLEWRETARWIKFEEDIEFGAEKWGKPHAPTLSYLSLMELRKCLETGR